MLGRIKRKELEEKSEVEKKRERNTLKKKE